MAQNKTPAASRRGFLRSGGMAALAGAVAAPFAVATAETPAISPELERLIEAHRQALALWEASDDDYGSALDHAECDAFDAVLTHRCDTIRDARAWAAYVVADARAHMGPETCVAALRALAGLPAEEEEV